MHYFIRKFWLQWLRPGISFHYLTYTQMDGKMRGTLKDSFVQSHPALECLDKVLGWSIMLGLLAVESLDVVTSITSFVSQPYALGLFTVASSMCSWNITLLTLFVWHAFCYYEPRMRKIMTTATRFTPDGFMRIGTMAGSSYRETISGLRMAWHLKTP